jgi:hypothetical protein
VDDGDRARRVVQHGLGDRAEAHAADAAAAPAAHNHQLRLAGSGQQRIPRRAMRDLPQHRDIGVLFLQQSHRVAEVRFHLPCAAEHARRVGQCAYRQQRDLTQLGLAEGERGHGARGR